MRVTEIEAPAKEGDNPCVVVVKLRFEEEEIRQRHYWIDPWPHKLRCVVESAALLAILFSGCCAMYLLVQKLTSY